MKDVPQASYCGRLAPSPTGWLHLGHAATFRAAWQRARAVGGRLILRIEDLDPDRCRPEYTAAALEDLRWCGLDWDAGPDSGGPEGPYAQSERMEHYRAAWRRLAEGGWIYPCRRTRRELREAVSAPHAAEPVYPVRWRSPSLPVEALPDTPDGVNWRFRVPDHRRIEFVDGRLGPCGYTALQDFGDFLIWRKDGVPAYELAVVVDDLAMGITEVVRGEDLLISTARQRLVYEALGGKPPAFYHTALVCDREGRRLAKRDGAEGLRSLRDRGLDLETALRELVGA